MNWQELIIAIKRATQGTLVSIAKETGLSIDVIGGMHSGRHTSRVEFNTGITLIEYAKEVGADMSRVKL